MGGLEQLIEHWGLAAVFVGAMAEGESVVLAGGAAAQRGLFPLWAVIAMAFAGTVAMDQTCFLFGRRFRTHRWIRAVRAKPLFDRAIGFIERYPNGYILAFRFLPGLRIVSPIALGVSRVPAARFVLLNLVAGAVWAPLFGVLGYEAGKAADRIFGRVRSGERYILILLAVLVAGGIAFSLAHRLAERRKERRAGKGVTVP